LIELTSGQKKALDMARSGKNLLILGSGGVGKSYLIEKIFKDEFRDSAFFTATTGIAAVNIEGQTVHSLFNLPIGFQVDNTWLDKISSKTKKAFKNTKRLKRIIIDEVSMARADMIDYIDMRLRQLLKVNKPFGGLQVIMVGDLLQLPPVLKPRTTESKLFYDVYNTLHCFSAKVFSEIDLEVLNLTQVLRQSDETLKRHLEDIRFGVNIKEAVDYFNTNCYGKTLPTDCVYIVTTSKLMISITENLMKTRITLKSLRVSPKAWLT
jgi:hypothetical protein